MGGPRHRRHRYGQGNGPAPGSLGGATAHFHATGHPVMRSAQPGETWRWCYVDEALG